MADGDLVRPVKWESPSTGGTEDDRVPTEANVHEDCIGIRGTYLQPPAPDPIDKDVATGRDASGNMTFKDKFNTIKTLTELLAGTGGLTEEGHKILRQLIHFIDDGPAEGFASGAYREILNPSAKPDGFVWWESALKLKKIVRLLLTWTGNLVTQEEWEVFDTDGSTVLATVTDAISYSGIFETSRTRTITLPP